jgi:membrane protein implicated in regulation of membrane protease activity
LGNFLYWALRTTLLLLVVATVYFAILFAEGRWWLQLAMVAGLAVIYSLLDQPLREMRGRGR